MSLSLCTVTYNGLRSKLPRLLYSIDKLVRGEYLTHYVWDNNSKDGTDEWLWDHAGPKITPNLAESNFYDLPAYNYIAELASEDYLLIINQNTRVIGNMDLDVLLRPFHDDPKLLILGRMGPGPLVYAKDATPSGVEGWGWCARLLTERDFWDDIETEHTRHVGTFCFLIDRKKFLEIGGFRFSNPLFDMNKPGERFPERPLDFSDKGTMIASEIDLSVRARRSGFTVGCAFRWPFYHYFSHGDTLSSIEKLDAIDVSVGISPLGYTWGMMSEDKYYRE